MKPLLAKDLSAFMQRFDNFKNAEIRSIEVVSPTQIELTLAGQDAARAFDWITLTLAFNEIQDARIIENVKLHLVDMSEGISCIYEANSFAFGVGNIQNLSSIKNSVSYIVSESLKYQEGSF